MLDPVPDAEKIETVREIVNVSSAAEVAGRIAVISQAAWTATLNDVTEWSRLKNKHSVIKGDGILIDKSVNRLDIRNRLRVRLGYPEVNASGQVIFDYERDETTSVDIFGGW